MWEKIKAEIIHVIPAVIFFAIAFNLIAFTENLMLPRFHYTHTTFTAAIIGALVVGKMLIIVNAFSIVDAFPSKPIIYNTVWKATIYSVAAFFFRIIENFIESRFHLGSWHAAALHIDKMVYSPIFWAIQLWLTMLFTLYALASELARVLGQKRVNEMVFGVRKKIFKFDKHEEN